VESFGLAAMAPGSTFLIDYSKDLIFCGAEYSHLFIYLLGGINVIERNLIRDLVIPWSSLMDLCYFYREDVRDIPFSLFRFENLAEIHITEGRARGPRFSPNDRMEDSIDCKDTYHISLVNEKDWVFGERSYYDKAIKERVTAEWKNAKDRPMIQLSYCRLTGAGVEDETEESDNDDIWGIRGAHADNAILCWLKGKNGRGLWPLGYGNQFEHEDGYEQTLVEKLACWRWISRIGDAFFHTL